jgi:hypothetical protein
MDWHVLLARVLRAIYNVNKPLMEVVGLAMIHRVC